MDKKSKILFTIECYPPEINGSGIATKRIATGLAKRGYDVAVACPGKGLKLEKSIEDEVKVYRLSAIPVLIHKDYYFSPLARRFMSYMFDDFNPDLIHIADHFFISSAACLEAKKRNIKIMGTNHFHPGNILSHSKIKRDLAVYKILERMFWVSFVKIFNNISLVTVPSETAAQIIKEKGIRRPIHIISNGLDLSYYKKKLNNKKILDKYNINSRNIILLSVSRLEKEKRIDLLIRALALIKNKSNFQFIIVGGGKEKNYLSRLARITNILDRVIFTGSVSDDELLRLYKLSDVFLSASEIELQGLSIMEAIASGLPVVAANSMAIPELVKNGINGYLFRSGDVREASQKILRVMDDKSLREEMAKKSLKLIKKHDFKNTLDKLENIYSLLTYKDKLPITEDKEILKHVFLD